VSKTPAKKTPPTPVAAKKPAAAVKKAAVAPKKTAAAKPVAAKKPATTQKPAAKTAPKSAPAGKAAAKPAAPAPKPAKPSSHPAAPLVAVKAEVKVPVSTTKPISPPAPAPVAATKPATRRPSKYAAMEQVQAPLPPPTSRFADRFAPPRPPTRQMNNLGLDVLKQTHKSDPKLANAWKSKSGRDLTEPELMAMPDSEYMNDKQLEFFRNKLQTLKDDLLSNAGETTEHLREDTSIVPDPVDRATIEEEHALELRTRDRERKLLKKISQSLARIEGGDYGFCDETGEPIGLGRLIARPTATLSLEAQQRRELKQKMFGD